MEFLDFIGLNLYRLLILNGLVEWISTPNQFHCEHTITAASHGKHVVVEKPMALTLDEAQRMTAAAEKHGVQLLCGHTASLMAANQAMRRLITSGAIGDVQAINVWSYTDWMFRPRMPQELDIRTGGGIVYPPGPPPGDTRRLPGGGRASRPGGRPRPAASRATWASWW